MYQGCTAYASRSKGSAVVTGVHEAVEEVVDREERKLPASTVSTKTDNNKDNDRGRRSETVVLLGGAAGSRESDVMACDY